MTLSLDKVIHEVLIRHAVQSKNYCNGTSHHELNLPDEIQLTQIRHEDQSYRNVVSYKGHQVYTGKTKDGNIFETQPIIPGKWTEKVIKKHIHSK